jgi:RNA polymerase sigma-70 factor (ECF subfamily)
MLKNQEIEQKTDQELVQMTLENQGDFLYIMNRYQSKLLAYILRISNVSYEEAEDILQDVFIKIYKNLNGYDHNLKFSSWIYRITHNEVISNFRKKQARPQSYESEINEEILDRITTDFDIEHEVNIKYLREIINKALVNLDEKYREVLILRFFEEKDYNEISDILKKPIGTISTLISRAKKYFKEELKKYPDINF